MLRNFLYKVINKLRKSFLLINYDYDDLLRKQEILYKNIDLDRKSAKNIIDQKYSEYPEVKDLASEHHLLFAAISIKNDTKSILEIGTYTGSCTKLFSVLFPEANIISIDLLTMILYL